MHLFFQKEVRHPCRYVKATLTTQTALCIPSLGCCFCK